jgi:vacuolar-type H+-ATPase subunit H
VNIQEIIGGCIAVIVAGMPAILALLKIRELHVLINSRLTQLMDATAKASHSEGQLEGRMEGRKSAGDEAATIIHEATGMAKDLLADSAAKARAIIADAAQTARRTLATATEEAGGGQANTLQEKPPCIY